MRVYFDQSRNLGFSLRAGVPKGTPAATSLLDVAAGSAFPTCYEEPFLAVRFA